MIIDAVALVIALIHFYVFYLESIAWGRPRTNKLFGVRSQAEAEANRVFAFNQGYYNLFLAVAILIGLVVKTMGHTVIGETLMAYGAASVFGAGIVLYASAKLVRPAVIQAGPGAAYLLLSYL